MDSRFCECRFEKRPFEEPVELERRRSFAVGKYEVPSDCLPFEEVEVFESFIVVNIIVEVCRI